MDGSLLTPGGPKLRGDRLARVANAFRADPGLGALRRDLRLAPRPRHLALGGRQLGGRLGLGLLPRRDERLAAHLVGQLAQARGGPLPEPLGGLAQLLLSLAPEPLARLAKLVL